MVDISSSEVKPRNEEAKAGMDKWREMSAPIPNFAEQCFYHSFDSKEAVAKIYNPSLIFLYRFYVSFITLMIRCQASFQES